MTLSLTGKTSGRKCLHSNRTMKPKWTRKAGAVLLLSIVGAGVLFFALSDKQGNAQSVVQLPTYGRDFPAGIHTERVNYLYNPRTKSLLATADISPGEFVKLCNHFSIEPLPYPKGFQDGVVTDTRFIPTNGYVYLAERKLYSGGRATLRLYLQPSEDSRQAGGRLFIHVMN